MGHSGHVHDAGGRPRTRRRVKDLGRSFLGTASRDQHLATLQQCGRVALAGALQLVGEGPSAGRWVINLCSELDQAASRCQYLAAI